MIAGFVVDCSVAATWLFKDELTPQTAALLGRLEDEAAWVPSMFYLELANVIALAEKRGRITPADSQSFLGSLMDLTFQTDDEASGRAFAHLLPLCRQHGLTSYDAVYLELALRRGLPLATIDRDLIKAARKLGLHVLGR